MTITSAAQAKLLSLFSRSELDGVAHESGVRNPTLMNRADLEEVLLARWPAAVLRERVMRLLAAAEGAARPPADAPAPKMFTTAVAGVGPFCVEFADGEIIHTRSKDRQEALAALVR